MRTFVLFLLAFPSKTSKWNKIHHPSTQAVFVFHALLITFFDCKSRLSFKLFPLNISNQWQSGTQKYFQKTQISENDENNNQPENWTNLDF